jgi:2,3-bisphosphoglycerate-independent phosphoglycerate mutase
VNVDPVTHERHTAHTLNVVPAILTEKGHIMHTGALSDIAPTILSLLGLSTPKEMTGKKLID